MMKKLWFGSVSLALGTLLLPIAINSMAIASSSSSQPSNFNNFGTVNDQKISQKQQPISLLLAAELKQVRRDQNGSEKISWNQLPPNAQVIPGSTLRYIVTAANNTDRNMRNLSVIQPVPEGMVYVMQSATKANATNASVEFSIDGGKTFSTKPVVRVRGRDGKVEERPAPADAYTHVRWDFGETLPANSQVQVSYQVRVR